MSSCADIGPRLEEYVADALERNRRQEVDDHLRACAACRQELRRIRTLEEELRAAAKEEGEPTSAEMAEGLRNVKHRLNRGPFWKGVVPMAAAAALILATLVWTLMPWGPQEKATTSQDGKVRLEWKLKKGQKLRYEMTVTNQTIFGDIRSEKERMCYGLSMEVREVTEGGAFIDVTYDRAAIAGAQAVDYDSDRDSGPSDHAAAKAFAALVGERFVMKLDRRGNVVEVTGFHGIAGKLRRAVGEDASKFADVLETQFTDELVKNRLQQCLPVLPEDPVAPGDVWQHEQALPTPGRAHVKSTLKELRDSRAAIVQQMNVEIEAETEDVEVPPVIRKPPVTGSAGRGESLWRIGEGVVESAATTIEVSVPWAVGELTTVRTFEMKLAPRGQPAQPQDEFQKLIEELGSDNPVERDRASDALLKAGQKALPSLEKAFRESQDPEIRGRLDKLLDQLRPFVSMREAISAFRKDPEALKDLWFRVVSDRSFDKGDVLGYVRLSTRRDGEEWVFEDVACIKALNAGPDHRRDGELTKIECTLRIRDEGFNLLKIAVALTDRGGVEGDVEMKGAYTLEEGGWKSEVKGRRTEEELGLFRDYFVPALIWARLARYRPLLPDLLTVRAFAEDFRTDEGIEIRRPREDPPEGGRVFRFTIGLWEKRWRRWDWLTPDKLEECRNRYRALLGAGIRRIEFGEDGIIEACGPAEKELNALLEAIKK